MDARGSCGAVAGSGSISLFSPLAPCPPKPYLRPHNCFPCPHPSQRSSHTVHTLSQGLPCVCSSDNCAAPATRDNSCRLSSWLYDTSSLRSPDRLSMPLKSCSWFRDSSSTSRLLRPANGSMLTRRLP